MFGRWDDHFEADGQIISRETIEQSIDEGGVGRIVQDSEKIGGAQFEDGMFRFERRMD